MSNLFLKVEYRPEHQGRMLEVEPLVGTDLLDALQEAKALAVKLEVGIMFAFNGEDAWIFPWQDPHEQYTALWHAWGWPQQAPEEEA